MEENKPTNWRPQDDLIRNADMGDPDARRAVIDLAEGQILSKLEVLGILNRIDPNDEREMLIVVVALAEEFPFEFKAQDFDFLAAKIDPNTLIGSYVAMMLQSEGLLSDEAYEMIQNQVDVSKIKLSEPESEWGTTLENLVEVGLVQLNVPKSPVLSFDALSRQTGVFN